MNIKYQSILEEYAKLERELAETRDPQRLKALGKRQKELETTVLKIQQLKEIEKQIEENKELSREPEREIAELARSELIKLEATKTLLEEELRVLVLPRDPLDEKNIIMEIRAGAGGGDIYGKLKYESGVHRVQRVPNTEKTGRVHTSTVTVAVLPEIEEIDLKIDPKDLKIEASTSSGAGGQSVNTTYSAIKITHLPTGITAQSQDERSQTQNKEKALQVIRARVYEYEEQKKQKELREKRRSMIGTGDRSEKIRTYNFPQDRVTDHRINQNFGQINLILGGKIEPIIDAVIKTDRERQLAAENKF